ncbi:hypothetical protein GWI33_003827 [Rhynchophorus ferrugineus]|uniref:Uncharacterized protein n=1 Tax=Rhynchophorus ferrugineus TaxID=354439 RepID=A0A834IM15_RHYFE|nr:hypothetical protein GWI33_003827 [Rhynchophorus ferrugineus]
MGKTVYPTNHKPFCIATPDREIVRWKKTKKKCQPPPLPYNFSAQDSVPDQFAYSCEISFAGPVSVSIFPLTVGRCWSFLREFTRSYRNFCELFAGPGGSYSIFSASEFCGDFNSGNFFE